MFISRFLDVMAVLNLRNVILKLVRRIIRVLKSKRLAWDIN